MDEGVWAQDSLQLSTEKKRRIVENRRQLLLNLEQLLRKQNMVRQHCIQHKRTWHPVTNLWQCADTMENSLPSHAQGEGESEQEQLPPHPCRLRVSSVLGMGRHTAACSHQTCQPPARPLQVVDLLQNSMPLRYDDLSASQAFLKATMAVNDLTTDLHKHHGAVRDFMREILSSVCYSLPLQRWV